jgi:hypothetical protein
VDTLIKVLLLADTDHRIRYRLHWQAEVSKATAATLEGYTKQQSNIGNIIKGKKVKEMKVNETVRNLRRSEERKKV